MARSRQAVDGSHRPFENRHIRAVASGEDEFPIQEFVRRMLVRIGEDPDREGLLKTPARVELAIEKLTCGYQQSVEDVVNGAIFEEQHESMILVRDVEVYSL